jgi:hypothetical protein
MLEIPGMATSENTQDILMSISAQNTYSSTSSSLEGVLIPMMSLCGSTADLVVHLLQACSWNSVITFLSAIMVILDSRTMLQRSLQYRCVRLIREWNYMEPLLLEYKCEYLLPGPAVHIYITQHIHTLTLFFRAGVGYSYADYGETVETTEDAARNVYAFM